MSAAIERRITLDSKTDHWLGSFDALGGPCEVLIEAPDSLRARHLVEIAAREAWRIEKKFSRYRSDSVVHAINTSGGRPVHVDEETVRLLDFADLAFTLSDGLFDITSGILRNAWTFDGGDGVPSSEDIAPLLRRIGWTRVGRDSTSITVPSGMELDLGGIGKEYAVDTAATRIGTEVRACAVVNFGGDLHVTGPRADGRPWRVGVERPGATEEASEAVTVIDVFRGGIATSGDSRRYVLKDGVRYGHVLNPQTGFPEPGAPRAVTVLADSCTEAGFLSTLAMLKGAGAESFLDGEDVRYWCFR